MFLKRGMVISYGEAVHRPVYKCRRCPCISELWRQKRERYSLQVIVKYIYVKKKYTFLKIKIASYSADESTWSNCFANGLVDKIFDRTRNACKCDRKNSKEKKNHGHVFPHVSAWDHRFEKETFIALSRLWRRNIFWALFWFFFTPVRSLATPSEVLRVLFITGINDFIRDESSFRV